MKMQNSLQNSCRTDWNPERESIERTNPVNLSRTQLCFFFHKVKTVLSLHSLTHLNRIINVNTCECERCKNLPVTTRSKTHAQKVHCANTEHTTKSIKRFTRTYYEAMIAICETYKQYRLREPSCRSLSYLLHRYDSRMYMYKNEMPTKEKFFYRLFINTG